jgi:hypothetical protein
MQGHFSGDLVRLIKLLGKGLDHQRLSPNDYDRLNELVSSLIGRCDSESELRPFVRALSGADLKQVIAEQLGLL